MRMFSITSVIAAGLVAAAPVLAQGTAQNRMTLDKQLVANETAINEAVMKHDATAFRKLVADDAVAVDAMGISSAADFVKAMDALKFEPGWKIAEPKVTWISDDVAVLVYHWYGKGTMGGVPLPQHTLSSTVWARRSGQWKAVFHQETPPMETKK